MDFFNNTPAITAILSWLLAQIAKFMMNVFNNKKITLERLWGAGGMPSSHSAGVCGLAAATGRIEGVGSVNFAIALMLALIVMYDASGVRRAAGKHAREINKIKLIINKLDSEIHAESPKADEVFPEVTSKKRIFKKNKLEEQMEQLKEFLGHEPLEVFFGALIGIGLGILIPALNINEFIFN